MSLSSQKYNDCYYSLFSINGMLPERYRVIISNKLYEEKSKHSIFAKCNTCLKETEKSKLRVFDLTNDALEAFVSGNESKRVWRCPECNKINKISETRYIQETLQMPYFHQCVPEPPKRKEGLLDRSSYHRKMKVWIGTFLAELEFQMGKYRAEYIPKSEEMEDQNIDTSDEEEGED